MGFTHTERDRVTGGGFQNQIDIQTLINSNLIQT